MDDLRGALDEIGSIRRQMARSTEFRGYGPATLAATGGLAVLAAVAQAVWLPDAVGHERAYLLLWIGTAVLGCGLAGVEVWRRTKRIHSGISDEMIRMAVEQFLPAVVAGALLTAVLVGCVPGAAWMLPGLWQVLFGVGVFNSCRFLPRLVLVAGGWYLLTGLVCVGLGDARALAPWTMGLSFGAGQMLVAAALLPGRQEVQDGY